MVAFLIVNALSIVFLVYVLVNFLREGRRMKPGTRAISGVGYRWNPNVVVITHPISLFAQGGVAVLPLRAAAADSVAQTEPVSRNAKVLNMPAKPAPVQNARGPKFGVR